MTKTPWVRFFASDWLAGTRGMSAAETGIYITLIASMYERGDPLIEDHARLSRLCGASAATFKKTLENLIENGKIIRLENGLWNDRVEKEREYSSKKSEAGSQAANALWEKKRNKNKGAVDATASITQSDRNANQNQIPDIDSVPNGTAAKAAIEPDFRDLLWTDGLSSIKRQTGKLDSSARQMIGKWCRDSRDDCRLVFNKIKQAETDRIGDPIPWITQSIAGARASPQKPKSEFMQRQQSIKNQLVRDISGEIDEFTGQTFDLAAADYRAH